MALDVHLVRDVNERWGFELVGGADDEMPITIEKLQSSSPASRAGLQNGDVVLMINGEEAIDFTHEEACRKIAECGEKLTIGVMRGLYDPVLDDQDPICYEPGDLDPPSPPTEVPFEIQHFLEPADLGSNLIDYGDSKDPLGTPFDPSILLNDPRSLTASPFVAPTKPYRPFSTEPINEVPPLEEPIILNPDYKDQFGESPEDINPDYILNAHNINGGFGAKFKLPISEQYDPDGTKLVRNAEIDNVLSKYVNMEMMSKKTVVTDEKVTKKSVKDVKVTEKTTTDIKTDTKVLKDSKKVSVNIDESLSEDTIKRESLTIRTEDLSIKEQSLKQDIKVLEKTETSTEEKEEKIIKEELKYIEKMKQEIDIAQIEKTALSVVEDSIERAVSVAEEIKKEMEEESSSETELKTETVIAEAEKKVSSAKSEKKMKESVEIIESESKAEAKETEFEAIDKIASNKEHLQFIEENENKEEISEKNAKKDIKATFETKSTSEEYKESIIKEVPNRKEYFAEENKQSANKGEFKKVTKTVTTGTKSDKTGAQQRTYAIGLQTIPNIRGVVHSSYHYDLLLRTFFLHLTDVMVALSRFVLTQPIFNTESSETRETISESQTYQSETKDVKKSQQEVVESVKKVEKQKVDEAKMKVEVKHDKRVEERKEIVKPAAVQEKMQEIKAASQKVEKKVEERKIEKRELVTPVHMKETKMEAHENVKKETTEQVIVKEDNTKVKEKKAVSGAEMAQRTEKKLSKDMTHKMDAVITEFQTIAVEEDKKEMLQRSRRSRSRSRIEEEVARESDPLEWLDKVDSRRASQEICEERLSKKEYLSSATFEKKSIEKLEKQEIKHKKSKPPKQMYVAVVEAHVYTNKDVIFEDAAEFSETSSVQSAEEVNTAFEAIETMSTENVALESAVQQIEQAKIVEESHELSRVSAQCAATIQKTEELVHESKNIVHEEYKKETALQSTDIKEVLIQETKEVIEPIVEIKETIKKENVTVDINESLSVAESKVVNIEETKSEFTSVESKQESVAIIEEEYRESAVVEASAEIMESKQKVEVKKAVEVVKVKEEPKVQIENVTEKVVLKSEKADIKKEDEYAALKIVKEIETEIATGNDIIEIEEEEVKRVEISKELSLDQSTVAVSSAVDVSLESESILKSEISLKSNQVTIEKLQSSYTSEDIIQESSFTARSVDKKLSLRTDLETQGSIQSPPSTIDTPTPSTIPPTPLTDEYVFKFTLPLPKRGTTPIPRDCTLSPEDEDPHIVKKKLIPHIETTIEKVVYDTPLPTPPENKVQSPIFKMPGLFGGASKPIYKIRFPPIYRKPGLFGGADDPVYNKEEIREIERKSSLLASAIDETIKSIEEYKEEVGIEKKKEVNVTEFKKETISKSYKENYSENIVMESTQNGVEESETTIEEIIETNDVVNGNNAFNEIYSITEENSTEYSVKTDVAKEEVTEKLQTEIRKEISECASIKEIENEIESKENEITIEVKSASQANIAENRKKEVEIAETEVKEEHVSDEKKREEQNEKKDPMLGFRSVMFDPESIQKRGNQHIVIQEPWNQEARGTPYLTESGEVIGTIQGIVDGLEEPVMDPELAKQLGKPGISEEKIAELISGEAEMLREAHVMGLTRVLNSHMNRLDDSSVDFQKIKPMIDSLKDSEVLKALNEDLARQKEEQRKKEEKRWTTFLQKPKRAPPKAKFGYHGWTEAEQVLAEEPYKVKIVKQAKPKVAPDYKPEDFDTGPLPWEERANTEPTLPPVEAEEPILIPEIPEYLEAVDPLKESEVPDLEDTGLPLPPPREPTPPPEPEQTSEEEPLIEEEPEEQEVTEVIEKEPQETREDMENRLAEQLVKSVQGMVDPNASVDQQLSQMRAQLAALAQLPEVIQQTLALVSQQLNKMTQQEAHVEMKPSHTESHSNQEMEVNENHVAESQIVQSSENSEVIQNEVTYENGTEKLTIEEIEDKKSEDRVEQKMQEEIRVQTPQITEEDMKIEKMHKEQQYQSRIDAEARRIKQRPTPPVGKPKRMFGPLDPDSRPVVLPGGRRWRKTSDVYNEQMIAETLQAQSELIQGKAMGFESDLLPYDNRVNFMKYVKPPVSLDHLQKSETYKLVHDMDQPPLKRVEMLTPVIAEADYRERCRSTTPSGGEKKHMHIPQQFHP